MPTRSRLGAAPDHIIGRVHAITDDGVVLVGSGTGSLIGKTLTLEADVGARITVILVPERLGF